MLDGVLLTAGLFDVNVDADVFLSWVKADLLPKLPPDCVVAMDNATFHKRPDIVAAIGEAGHAVAFLPAYSPDFNPIEKFWAFVKKLRKRLLCSVYSLFKIESFYLR